VATRNLQICKNDDTVDDMTETKVTYEVCVTPRFDGLEPVYNALIYRNVEAGVCGPFSGEFGFPSLEFVDNWLGSNGFTRTARYGNVCSNGFATAPIEIIPTERAREAAAKAER
jgi:hypothetical protein